MKPAWFVRACWLIAPLLLCACGAKGPPKPPLSKAPEPVQNLFVRQSGPSIEVRWSRPSHRTDGSPIEGPLVYEVLVRAEDRTQTVARGGAAGQSRLLPRSGEGAAETRAAEESFFKSASVAASLAEPGATLGGRGRTETPIAQAEGKSPFQVVVDLERLSGLRPTGVRLAVAVVARDVRGRRSRPGTIAEIDPVAPLPSLVTFTASGTREGVKLSWRIPAVAGPAGVNIYRRLASSDPARGFPTKPISGSPFAGDSTLDTSAQLGESYVYEGRLVSTTPGKGVRESLPVTASIEYTDRFPPGPPSLLTAELVTGDGTQPSQVVRLRWSPPIDADVARYRIYRADGDGQPTVRGQVTAAQTLWEDTQVVPGVQYHYAVTAIDGANPPNESERSETVDVDFPEAARPDAEMR